MIYMSPDPYFDAFEEVLDLRHANLNTHTTAGLELTESNGRVHLKSMTPSTPAAKIARLRSRLRGAWLIKVGDNSVSSVSDVHLALMKLMERHSTSVTLLFAHPEIRPSVSQDGLPIVSSAPFTQHIHDQLNNRWEFTTVAQHLRSCTPSYQTVDSVGV